MGEVTADEVISKLSYMPYQDLGFVKADHHRELRTGFPEVIFGQGKTTEQVVSISNEILKFSERLMITRASDEMYSEIKKLYAEAQYHHDAKAITVDIRGSVLKEKGVLIVSAGTSDLRKQAQAKADKERTKAQRKKREDQLTDEMFDIENELCETIQYVVNAEWDAPTLKRKIELLLKNRHDVVDELDEAGYFDDVEEEKE